MLNNLHYSKTFINNYFGTSKDLVHMDGLSLHSIKNLMNEEMYSYEYKANESNDYFFIIKNHDYSLKELSYIYQLYGVLEECSKMVEFYWKSGSPDNIAVRNSYKNVLEKIYGDNYLKILSKNIDDISYKELYSDCLMKEGYRNILKSLDEICNIEHE